MPASLKKLAFINENRPNLFPPFVGNFKQGRFLRRFTCFLAHRTRPAAGKEQIKNCKA